MTITKKLLISLIISFVAAAIVIAVMFFVPARHWENPNKECCDMILASTDYGFPFKFKEYFVGGFAGFSTDFFLISLIVDFLIYFSVVFVILLLVFRLETAKDIVKAASKSIIFGFFIALIVMSPFIVSSLLNFIITTDFSFSFFVNFIRNMNFSNLFVSFGFSFFIVFYIIMATQIGKLYRNPKRLRAMI